MNVVKKQVKEELKQLAKDLRIQKKIFKSKQRDPNVDSWLDLRKMHSMCLINISLT